MARVHRTSKNAFRWCKWIWHIGYQSTTYGQQCVRVCMCLLSTCCVWHQQHLQRRRAEGGTRGRCLRRTDAHAYERTVLSSPWNALILPRCRYTTYRPPAVRLIDWLMALVELVKNRSIDWHSLLDRPATDIGNRWTGGSLDCFVRLYAEMDTFWFNPDNIAWLSTTSDPIWHQI